MKIIIRLFKLILFVPLAVIFAFVDVCIYPILLIKWVIDGEKIIDPPLSNLLQNL